jgi:hypothetical protein
MGSMVTGSLGGELAAALFVGFGEVRLEGGERPRGLVVFAPPFSSSEENSSFFEDLERESEGSRVTNVDTSNC